jgi:hypothetical protein
MRTMKIGVLVLLFLAAMSLAALPQEPTVGGGLKYGSFMSMWIGKHFSLSESRDFAYEMAEANADYTLVAVGADFAEFKSRREKVRLMVPLAVLRFQLSAMPK